MKPTFNNLYEIPEAIRILQGARLDFEQAIALINRSYELGKDGNPDLGAAKSEFFDAYVIEGDIWVKPAK
jgi:hypothetical protein